MKRHVNKFREQYDNKDNIIGESKIKQSNEFIIKKYFIKLYNNKDKGKLEIKY